MLRKGDVLESHSPDDNQTLLLRKGDILESAGNGYNLHIPGYHSPDFKKLHQESRDFIGDSKGKELVGKLLEFVYQTIEYDSCWNDVEKDVSLERSWQKRKGVCKEIAATLDMLYRVYEIDSDYIRGIYQGARHAWLKVRVDDKELLVDPTNDILGNYESVSRIRGFIEGKNNIKRSI